MIELEGTQQKVKICKLCARHEDIHREDRSSSHPVILNVGTAW